MVWFPRIKQGNMIKSYFIPQFRSFDFVLKQFNNRIVYIMSIVILYRLFQKILQRQYVLILFNDNYLANHNGNK